MRTGWLIAADRCNPRARRRVAHQMLQGSDATSHSLAPGSAAGGSPSKARQPRRRETADEDSRPTFAGRPSSTARSAGYCERTRIQSTMITTGAAGTPLVKVEAEIRTGIEAEGSVVVTVSINTLSS